MYWSTSIADVSAPTAAEISAATDLTPAPAAIADLRNWSRELTAVTYQPVDTPMQVAHAGGYTLPGDPEIVFYDDPADAGAVRAALAESTAGFVILAIDGAPGVGDGVEVWPVTSLGPETRWTADTVPARFRVRFAVTATPDTAATVAA